MGKAELHVEIDAELLAYAEQKGVELGPAVEAGIRAALAKRADLDLVARLERQRQNPAAAEAAARRWAEENAEAIEAYARRVEERGAFGEDLRRW
ncbi:MAG TPA: type II toxin-antitoxin system CcdA family antitoxin [Caulobacteraceae bacterium]|jgi:antitoxin CcdA